MTGEQVYFLIGVQVCFLTGEQEKQEAIQSLLFSQPTEGRYCSRKLDSLLFLLFSCLKTPIEKNE